MPKPMQSDASNSGSAVPSNVKIDPNTVKFGKKNSVRTITFTEVVNNRATSSKNSSNTAVSVFKSPAFVGGFTSDLDFDITKYSRVGSVETCASHLSNSQEIKKRLISDGFLELPISTSYSLFLCSEIQATSIENAVSFNKACAIMAYQILAHTVMEKYDWEQFKAVEVVIKERKNPSISIVNRLAGQMRLPQSSLYYWMVVPGYEFLYDVFPIETIALTMVRLECRKALNIPETITNAEIVNSLVSKMNRKHDLTKVSISEIITKLGVNNIKDMYNEFRRNVGTTGREIRNEHAVKEFLDFIGKYCGSST
nr:coat protein [Actinidia chlorotic ringspot-associated virus]